MEPLDEGLSVTRNRFVIKILAASAMKGRLIIWTPCQVPMRVFVLFGKHSNGLASSVSGIDCHHIYAVHEEESNQRSTVGL